MSADDVVPKGPGEAITANGAVSGYLAGTSSIGKYFSLVSAVPALLLTLYTTALVTSGAWTGEPSVERLVASAATFDLEGAAALVLISLTVGLTIHPLQYSMVQVLEGYWGASRPALWMASALAWRHRRRLLALITAQSEEAPGSPTTRSELAQLMATRESQRLSARYPDRASDVMPTSLGNVLRRYEFKAGSQYGIDATIVAPMLYNVVPAEFVGYLNDRRSELDLAIRMCVTWLLATSISVIFLWNKGTWLAIALATYGFAYISYQSAVRSAIEYASTVDTAINLHRFDLLKALHMPLPPDNDTEVITNEDLMTLLVGERTPVVYEHHDGSPTK